MLRIDVTTIGAMVMVGHEKRLSEPLSWTRGGRLAVIAAVVCLALGAIALGLLGAFGSSSRAPGCIQVTFASTVGGATVHACGEKARTACAHPELNRVAAAHGLRAECSRAGLPYGT